MSQLPVAVYSNPLATFTIDQISKDATQRTSAAYSTNGLAFLSCAISFTREGGKPSRLRISCQQNHGEVFAMLQNILKVRKKTFFFLILQMQSLIWEQNPQFVRHYKLYPSCSIIKKIHQLKSDKRSKLSWIAAAALLTRKCVKLVPSRRELGSSFASPPTEEKVGGRTVAERRWDTPSPARSRAGVGAVCDRRTAPGFCTILLEHYQLDKLRALRSGQDNLGNVSTDRNSTRCSQQIRIISSFSCTRNILALTTF